MSKFTKVYYQLENIEDESSSDYFMNKLHPLIKLITTIAFIIIVISINKYDLTRLLYLIIYPISLIMFSNARVRTVLKIFLLITPFFIITGLFNIFLDRVPIFYINSFSVTSGMISFITLLIKGFYTVIASYFFVVTTGINKIIYALKSLHMPNILINLILLIYRYIFVFIQEANDMYQAYSLRTIKQKGIWFKDWGFFLGILFLKTTQKADNLYKSMELKGFKDKLYYFKTINYRIIDIVYLFLCFSSMLIIKFMR